MLAKLKWKTILVVSITGLAIWLSIPPFPTYNNEGKIVKEGRLNLGLDLQGGMNIVLEVDTSKLSENEAKDAPQRALEIIRNRIDQFGVTEPLVQLQGKNRIFVQLPGITDRQRAKEIIAKTAHLEFRLVSDDADLLKKALEGQPVEGYELKYMKNKDEKQEPLLVETKTSLTGDMLVDASTEFSQQGFGQPYVSLTFSEKGGAIFSNLTGANVGKRLAVVLDGEVYTAPVIRERIPSGRAQITGNFSVQEAKDLALVLRAGALPAPVSIVEERSVGPTLGRDSIESGIRATLIGGMLVLGFMAIYYTLGGLIADLALVLNILMITAALSLFKGTLTLPGIAGLVLTFGMSVDANILISERMREELALGKNMRAAIAAGYDKAFGAIFDSNLTILITSLILFQFGTGPVKGFATTLSIGVVASMFSALTVTHCIFDLIVTAKSNLKFTMLQFFRNPNIPFMKLRRYAYVLSLTLIIVGMYVFIQRGVKNYGVDFTGGTLQEFSFKEKVRIDDIRSVLKNSGFGESSIQQVGQSNTFIVRTYGGKVDGVVSGLTDKFGKGSFELLRAEEVGPTVEADLRKNAIKALLFSFVGICIYVSLRFEFKFAATGILALVHDVLVSLGAVALTGREISLNVVAALLTIVGYSINDTIVIFDRIRENRKFMRKSGEEELINLSINQTLSRTVLTSLCTLMVTVALFLFGGEAINDFAFVMMIGVIVGSYSTIFVAAPLLIDWPSRRAAVRK
ncbi:MAG: protein translocase subunit SecD [Candidatus Omnitrophica bacterium]|nr:protein translocase subunit SecD [Candidatus Omnitrophota bacterium]